MLRKVLLRALIVGALLVAATLPAAAAFTPDRVGPWCTSNIDLIQPDDALLPQGSCGTIAPTVSSLTVPFSAVPSWALIEKIEIVVKFRYADPAGINLMIDPPWRPTPPIPLHQGKPANMAGDLTWTYVGEVPYWPTLVAGEWRLRASYGGALLPDPQALPKIDWWSVQIIYKYPCTSMSGTVLNKADGTPMAGVEVQLYRNHGNPFPGQWVGKTTTDAAGNFSFVQDIPWLNWAAWAVVAVPPAGFHAAGVGCPYHPDPSPFERGPNAIGVPYFPWNWAGLKFFMEESAPIDPPHVTSTFAAVADTYISEWTPTKAHGSEGNMRIRNAGTEAALLKFDLGGASGTVYKATLKLHANLRTSTVPMKVGAYKVLTDWTEAVKWGGVSVDPTVAGEGKVCNGFGKNAIVSCPIDVDVTTLVQGWVADPTTNLGVYLAGIAEGSTAVTVDSSESIWEAFQPVLVVEWE